MPDDEYEIHPLDRDYSAPYKLPKRKRFAHLSKIHRAGLAAFGAGFFTLVISAIALGNVPQGGWLQSIGSFLHRLAMYAILGGGVLILLAYHGYNAGRPLKQPVSPPPTPKPKAAKSAEPEEVIEPEIDESMIAVTRSGGLLSGCAITISLILLSASLATVVAWQSGWNSRVANVFIMYSSLAGIVGYPTALACCWIIVCDSTRDHLYAKIGATISILGSVQMFLASLFFFSSWVPLLMIVTLIAGATIVSVLKGKGITGPKRVAPAYRESRLGIFVTLMALAWFGFSTAGLAQPGAMFWLYSGNASYVLLATFAIAVAAYWQPHRDLYYAGLGGLFIVGLPNLPLFLRSTTSMPTTIAVVTLVWVLAIGLVLGRTVSQGRRSGWL